MAKIVKTQNMFTDEEKVVVDIAIRAGNIYDQVEAVVSAIVESRDDDMLLWLEVCRRFYGLESALGDYETFAAWLRSGRVPSFETVARRRREIRYKYPASPAVEVNRQLRGKGIGRPRRYNKKEGR